MASTMSNAGGTWSHTHGLTVFCTQGALGEWFTVVPASPLRARELQRRGVAAGVTLSWADVCWQLQRLGLAETEIHRAVDDARRSATVVTVLSTRRSIVGRVAGGIRRLRRVAALVLTL